MLWLKRNSLILVIILIVFGFLVLEHRPLVEKPDALDVLVTQQARESAKKLIDQLGSRQQFVNVRFNRDQLDAMSVVVSNIIPNVDFNFSYNHSIAIAATTLHFEGAPSLYLNLRCVFDLLKRRSELRVCYIGDLPLPGLVIEWISYGVASVFFGSDVADTVVDTYSSLNLDGDVLAIVFQKTADFKDDMLASVDKVTSAVKLINQTALVDKSRVKSYLDTLALYENNSNELSYFVHITMAKATVASKSSGPVAENTAILWALSIKFANPSFARLIDLQLDDDFSPSRVSIRGRYDHSLHFLYSAILEQLGRESFGFSIGELKELMDAGQGGSGFSFPDIVADRAGIAFSRRIRESDIIASKVQDLLATSPDTSLFFPFANDFPEGLTQSTFEGVFNNVESQKYKNIIDQIDKRILALPVMKSVNEGL